MFCIFLFLCLYIYYYKIIIFNIVVKRHEQLVDVSAIKVFNQLIILDSLTRGPFLESPGNFSGPESYFISARVP